MIKWYKQKNIWKNGVETIVDNDGILSLNEKYIEEGLDHKNLQTSTLKYLLNDRKHRYELVFCWFVWSTNTMQQNFYRQILDCRTTAAHKFRTRLEIKQFDVTLTKEQSVLTKIKNSFEGEDINTI